ncbi:SepM family pheromone-processing serine protease [Agrilactobacillus fermenti]|uniref:SepM family pheromone-processing serine protease n=1 Tax=Agrilactobacillus fermenti TaxID=2586909 RepID=UPI001E503B8A|nr:SepM family pheromone-processing serine protease [Agrilactobacillus fermenti]MCD2255261.1 PDZ domain-containing protein [Agrilactobacillus fermenti]
MATKSRWLWFRRLLIVIGLVGLAVVFLWPTNYYLESPGSAEDVSQFVKVDHQHAKTKGKFLLTTVQIQQATPIQLLIGHFRSFTDIYSKQELMGSASSAAYDRLQQYYIENSENTAIAQAAKRAKVPYQWHFIGVYVLDVLQQSSFQHKLQLGDTVSQVNGQKFTNTANFQKYVRHLKLGQKVSLTYTRNKKTHHAIGRLIRLPDTKRPGLGITLTDHTQIKTKRSIRVDAGAIGGPSAGLMFTLQIYDQLSQQHLLRGRTIAGTGTISTDGQVGPIGGIDKKVVAASKMGATVFFAPDDQLTKKERHAMPHYQNNYMIAKKAAQKIHTKMKIIPVRNLNDAIHYLEK